MPGGGVPGGGVPGGGVDGGGVPGGGVDGGGVPGGGVDGGGVLGGGVDGGGVLGGGVAGGGVLGGGVAGGGGGGGGVLDGGGMGTLGPTVPFPPPPPPQAARYSGELMTSAAVTAVTSKRLRGDEAMSVPWVDRSPVVRPRRGTRAVHAASVARHGVKRKSMYSRLGVRSHSGCGLGQGAGVRCVRGTLETNGLLSM